MTNNHPLTQAEFDVIYSKVPRLTVEVIVKNKRDELYLTKRAIEPCKGLWHLPGGTVRFGETMQIAVERIARRELGINVTGATQNGYIEYPSHYKNGLDSPVGIVFEVSAYDGEPVTNSEAEEFGWFTSLPSPMHADQDKFLLDSGYLRPFGS